jgi:hypothetical protein
MTDATQPDPNAIGLPGISPQLNLPSPALPLPSALPSQTGPETEPEATGPIGNFSQRFAQAADTIGVLPGVSGWAKSLVASAVAALPRKPLQPQQTSVQPQGQPQPSRAAQVLNAVQGITSSLGDAAAVGTVPSGGGALTGALRTLAARNERMSQDESNRILRAESQARTVTTMRNIYRQDRQDRLASYGQTKQLIDSMREDHNVQDGITQSQLNQMIKTNPGYLDTHTGGAIGEEPVFDANGKPMTDSNGNPIYSPVYALAEIQAKDGSQGSHEVTQGESDYFRRNTGTTLPAGTKLTTDQYVYLYKKSHSVQDTTDAIQKANDGQLSAENLRQVQTELQDPSIQRYAMMVPGQPLAGLYNAKKNAADHIAAIDKQIAVNQNPQSVQQLQQQRQTFVDEQQKIGHVIQFGFNDAAKEKYADFQLKQQEQAEKERHDRADEANKQTELKQKNQQNIISNLTGEDYLNTLPVAQQATVRAVGEGRQALPANRKEALALLEQVHQAYPDFDESKVKTWQKANNEYRGSGKTATQIIPAYNTALEHMQDLYNNTTLEGIFDPVSKAYQDRQIALGYVAREVGKAVSAGVMTQSESEDLLGTLKGGLTPALKRERITETAQLLHDKIDEYQTKFNESAPSSAVKVPTLISPQAAHSYDFVTGRAHPNSGVQTQAHVPQIQTGARPVIANGKTIGYTTDGKTMTPVGAQ